MSHRLKSSGKPILALLFGALLAAVVCELVVDLTLGTQVKFPRHVVEAPWGIRYNEPNSYYRHHSPDGKWFFDINAQGMRAEQDYAYQKPEGVKRIVSLGDSFTIGYEVTHEETFSKELEDRLNESGIDAQVLNAGVSGFSNAEELVYIKRELLKYEPDLVIVSFFGNDLVDNKRTGLFKLANGELKPWNENYVPAGSLGNFLNSNWLFNFLSARSDAFVFIKERATQLVKQQMVEANESELSQAADANSEEKGSPNASDAAKDTRTTQGGYRRRLAAAIFRNMYSVLRKHDVPLLIQSIPSQRGGPHVELVEMFPLDQFDVDQPGVGFVSMKKDLDPFVEDRLLYNQHSHYHWTPFAHAQSAKALAATIREQGLLNSSTENH